MKKIRAESLHALNQKLDIVRVLEEIGVADIADTHPEVLSSCPFHESDESEAVLTVDKKSHLVVCDESDCKLTGETTLIAVYSLATGKGIDESAAYWAEIVQLPLEYEDVADPEEAPPADEAVETLPVEEPADAVEPTAVEHAPAAESPPQVAPIETIPSGAAKALGPETGAASAQDPGAAFAQAEEDPAVEDTAPASASASEPASAPALAPAPEPATAPAPAPTSEPIPAAVREPITPEAVDPNAAQPAAGAAPGTGEPPQDLHTPAGEIDAADLEAFGEVDREASPEDIQVSGAVTTQLKVIPSEKPRHERERDEEAVLRYLLADDPGTLMEVRAHRLTPEDFRAGGALGQGSSIHGMLFHAICRVRDSRRPLSKQSVLDEVDESSRQAVEARLEAIVKGTATDPKRFRQALRRLADTVLKEHLESTLRASLADVMSRPNVDAASVLAQATERLRGLTRFDFGPLTSQETALPRIVQEVFDPEFVPIATFADGLNRILNGGLQFGRCCLLLGERGSGKTAFLLQLADHAAAVNQGRAEAGKPPIPVLYFATASSRRDLTVRSFARLERIHAGALLSRRWVSGWEGDFIESEVDIHEEVESVEAYYRRKVAEAQEAYRSLSPYLCIVEAAPTIAVERIRSYVLEGLRRFGAKTAVVVVDALNHVEAAGSGGVADAAAELKQLAISHSVSVLAGMDSGVAEVHEAGGLADVELLLRTDEDVLAAGSEAGASGLALAETLKRIQEKFPLEYSHSAYTVVEPIKNRTGSKNPAIFIFHKAWHMFEEVLA